jgi:uncharacterized RDD family membrane protein YckC
MNKLDTGTRLGTMVLDHIIMSFAVTILAAPGMVYDIVQIIGNPGAEPKLFLGNYYLNIFAFSLYFNKDIYLGRSPAKRILKLQIVDIKTNEPANPLKCLVRNLTIVIWPIEAIVALVNNERRIGDFIAGTKLMTYDPAQHPRSANWPSIVVAIAVSVLVVYFAFFYSIELLLGGSGLL